MCFAYIYFYFSLFFLCYPPRFQLHSNLACMQSLLCFVFTSFVMFTNLIPSLFYQKYCLHIAHWNKICLMSKKWPIRWERSTIVTNIPDSSISKFFLIVCWSVYLRKSNLCFYQNKSIQSRLLVCSLKHTFSFITLKSTVIV